MPLMLPVRHTDRTEIETAAQKLQRAAFKRTPLMADACATITRQAMADVDMTALVAALNDRDWHAVAAAIPDLSSVTVTITKAAGPTGGTGSSSTATQQSAEQLAQQLLTTFGDSQTFAASFAPRLDLVDPKMVDFARDRAGRFLTDLDANAIVNAREAVAFGIENGRTVRETARLLQSTMYLPPRGMNAVENYFKALVDQVEKGKALDEAARAAGAGRALAPTKFLDATNIDTLTQRYADRWVKYTADTVARTMTIEASNAGLIDGWNQAAEHGLFDASTATLVWYATDDDRTCPECDDLDGTEADFPDGGFGDVDFPPAHPDCRCTVVLITPDGVSTDIEDTGDVPDLTGDEGDVTAGEGDVGASEDVGAADQPEGDTEGVGGDLAPVVEQVAYEGSAPTYDVASFSLTNEGSRQITNAAADLLDLPIRGEYTPNGSATDVARGFIQQVNDAPKSRAQFFHGQMDSVDLKVGDQFDVPVWAVDRNLETPESYAGAGDNGGGTIFQIERGARVADVSKYEDVTSGRFEVVSVTTHKPTYFPAEHYNAEGAFVQNEPITIVRVRQVDTFDVPAPPSIDAAAEHAARVEEITNAPIASTVGADTMPQAHEMWLAQLRQAYADVDIQISDRGTYLSIDRLVGPKGSTDTRAALNDIIGRSETMGVHLSVTPSAAGEGNVSALGRFYRQSGFVKDEGKQYGNTMVRLVEPKAPEPVVPNPVDVHRAWIDQLRGDHPDTHVQVYDVAFGDKKYLQIDRLIAPKGSTEGRATLRDILAEADRRGVPVVVTPSGAGEGNAAALGRFYRQSGFVKNEGRYGVDEYVYFPKTFVEPGAPLPGVGIPAPVAPSTGPWTLTSDRVVFDSPEATQLFIGERIYEPVVDEGGYPITDVVSGADNAERLRAHVAALKAAEQST